MGLLSSKPSPPAPADDELEWMAFHGTVVSLHETYGVVSFVLGKKEVTARFERANTCLDGQVVPQRSPLPYTIRVGMRAYVHFVENECDADDSTVLYRAHVDVIETATRCQPEDYPCQEFRGTVTTPFLRGSTHPGVALIFLNGVEEKVTFWPYHRDIHFENWPVGHKVDICGIIPCNTLLAEEARYEACDAYVGSNVKSFQINTIVSFDSSTKSGSFYYDNYNGKVIIGFVVHEICSYNERSNLTMPELLSHIYAGQEVDIADFPVIMCKYDVYSVTVGINVRGRSMLVAGPKLRNRPDLPSMEDKLSLSERLWLDRVTVDRALEDRTAVISAALRKNTFLEAQQFPSNELPAGPPAAGRSDEFNLDNRREVTKVERSRRSVAAQTVDTGNERPSMSARNAEAAFADDLVRHDSGGDGDSDYVRLNYATRKVDFRSECASTSGQLFEPRYADVCIRDNLREAEGSAYVDRGETIEKASLAIAQTATSEWYSEEAFAEKYICGGRRDARRTEYSIRGTARSGLTDKQQSVWPNGPTMFGLSSTTALLDLQVDAKETGGSENNVVSSGLKKSERKADTRYFETEPRGQDKSENASGNSNRRPTADTFVPGNTTGKDREAVRAELAVTKTGGEPKKMDLNYAEKEVTWPTNSAAKFSRETETGKLVLSAARPCPVTSHEEVIRCCKLCCTCKTETAKPVLSAARPRVTSREEANMKIVHGAKVKIVPNDDVGTVPRADSLQPFEPTYSGVISSVYERSCVVAFTLNGREEAARCCRAYATLNGRPVQQDVSLKVTLEVGARAVLSRVEAWKGESNVQIRYKAVVDVKTNTKRVPSTDIRTVPSAQDTRPMAPTYSGFISSVSERSCVVAFRLNGRKEAARCCRADATLNGRPVQQDVSLKVTLEIGARAVLSYVEEHFGEADPDLGIRYKAVVDVEGAPKEKVTIVPAAAEKPDVCLSDLVVPGVVISVDDRFAVASCRLDGLDEKVLFSPQYVFVVGTSAPQGTPLYDVVPRGTPLCDVVTVGDKVTLSAVKHYSTAQDKTILYTARASVDRNDLSIALLSAKASVLPSSTNATAGLESSSLSTTTEPRLSLLNTTAELKPSWLHTTTYHKPSSLNTTKEFESSWLNTSAEPKMSLGHAAAVLKPPPPSTVTEPKPSSFVTTLDDLYNRTFPAVVFSLMPKSGVATFQLDGRMQKARFTRANVNIDGVVVPQNVPLSATLSVGTEIVLQKVEDHDEHDLTVLYKGNVSVIRRSGQLNYKDNLKTKSKVKILSQGAAPKQNVAKLQAKELKPSPIHILKESKMPVYNTGGKLYNRRIRAVVFYLQEKSGVATFTLGGREQKARFTRANVNIDGVVVSQNVPLSETLSVGTEIVLKKVEEHDEHDLTVLYKGNVSVITISGQLRAAGSLPTKTEVKISSTGAVPKQNVAKLQAAELKPSWLNTTAEPKKSPGHVAAELKPPPPSTVTEPKPSSFVTTLDDLYNRTFLAVIFSLKEKSGVASFQLNRRMQKARFTRANVNIDGVVVPQNVPLSEMLSVGTEIVLQKVEEHDEHDLTVLYKGNVSVIMRSNQLNSKDSLKTRTEVKISSTGVVPKQNVAKLQAVELKPLPIHILKESETPMFDASDELYDSAIPAFVDSLHKKSGVVKFKLEGDWQKARFTRANVYIDFDKVSVPQNVPLSETLNVGEEVLLLCVEEYEHDPTVLYKGTVCAFREVENLITKVAQKITSQSTATLATNKTQPNVTELQPKENLKTEPKVTKSRPLSQSAATLATNPTQSNIKPQAIDNLKTKFKVTKGLEVARKKIPLVARSSKILGTIKTLSISCIGGLAYFTHCGHKVTTLFVVNELIIDNCYWNPLFSKDIIREGMIVTLSDFELYENENYSYLTSASIVTKLSECQVVESRKPINYNLAVEKKPCRIGVILSMIDTESGRACPRVVAATINGRTEHVFVGDNKVAINGMPEAEYKHALPSDYFCVGMTVGLTKLKPCKSGSVGLSGLVASCTYEGGVDCINDGTCFIDTLRASQRVSSLGKEIKPVPPTPFLKSVPTKESTPVEMGSNSAASSTIAMTVEIESIAESGGGGGSSRLLIPEVERETDAGRAKVAVRWIKMSDGPRPAKCEMGTQTFITGPIVTKQCFVDI